MSTCGRLHTGWARLPTKILLRRFRRQATSYLGRSWPALQVEIDEEAKSLEVASILDSMAP